MFWIRRQKYYFLFMWPYVIIVVYARHKSTRPPPPASSPWHTAHPNRQPKASEKDKPDGRWQHVLVRKMNQSQAIPPCNKCTLFVCWVQRWFTHWIQHRLYLITWANIFSTIIRKELFLDVITLLPVARGTRWLQVEEGSTEVRISYLPYRYHFSSNSLQRLSKPYSVQAS